MKRLFISSILVLATLFAMAQSDTVSSDTLAASQPFATKASADALYEKEDYEAAAQMYEDIIVTQGTSADIYYNLGNCYYKLRDIAHAILNYERALLLDQGDSDIRTNLAIARGMTVDKVTPPSELFFVSWWHSFVNMLSIDTWAAVAIVTFVLMLVGIFVYLFFSPLLWRKIGVYGAIALLVVTVLANIAASSQRSSIIHRDSAIVMQSAVTVKSSPSESSTKLFLMHSGAKVEILDNTMKDWVEIKLEEGKEGWVRTDAIEII